mgnify:CR=1 FL=1
MSKKYNFTIIDEENIKQLIKIDKLNPPPYEPIHYKLLEERFVFGRYLYEQSSEKPIAYWFMEEGIANLTVRYFNSVLTDMELVDIIIRFYKENCLEIGNTLTLHIPERCVDVCNSLKKYCPKVEYSSPFIIFTLFLEEQQLWLTKELHVI